MGNNKCILVLVFPIFTLSNASQEDAGIYEVVVEGTHPATGSLITFKKRFHLLIGIPLKLL